MLAAIVPPEGGEPAQPEEWGARLLDLKGVARPPPFDGRVSSWGDWRFRILAVCDLLGLADLMQVAERNPTP
eukprot:7158400-Heterocapsa_arctica.AAC.1